MESSKKSFLFLCLLIVVLGGVFNIALGDDDPNLFNQVTGQSIVTLGTFSTNSSCGFETVAVRNGTAAEGSDGGQLTIKLNTCKIFNYSIERFPQSGGAGGTAQLEEGDLIIVWDEDVPHGESEEYKNFRFTGTYTKLQEAGYGGYLNLSSTDNVTNWGVYYVVTAGTFTKGSQAINEHEILHLTRNIMTFTKDDNVPDTNCVSPSEEITYSICWDNAYGDLVSGAYIIDWLDKGVTYPEGFERIDPNTMSIIPADPYYDPNTHSYIWFLDNIDPNTSGCLELEVVVNENAVPGMYLYNLAEMYLDDRLVATADEYTDVCCWVYEPNIIYVDQSAINGANTGLNWSDAYLDLADALERAGSSICSDAFIIYVAQGSYDPNNTADKTFVVPDNVSIYGGFKTGGCAFKDRKPKKYKTILTGLIDEDTIPDSDTIVEMGDNCLLDGCTVEYAYFGGYCIYGNGVDFAVNNCVVQDSYDYGIYAKNGDVTVTWCTVNGNTSDGIRHEGEGYELNVSNSWVMRNGENGVHSRKSKPILKNSIVSESNMSLAEEPFAGIRMYNPSDTPILRNCTFANNTAEGVYFEFDREDTNDPNNPKYPQVRSCIVYYNNSNGQQIRGLNPDAVASYCCIQDCNTLSTSNYNDIPGFAYAVDPNGAPDPNNYHLSASAFCINMGDPAFSDTAESDYDGEVRIMGSYVDIGADEVNPECSEVENDLDWNVDGILNLHEFNEFSKAWLSHDPADPALTDPNNPLYDDYNDPNSVNYIDPNSLANWNEECNVETFYSPYTIGMYDLMEFIDNGYWLWIACWKYEQLEAMSAASTSSIGTMSLMSVPAFSMSSAQTATIEEETAEEKADSIQASLDLLNSIWENDVEVRQNIDQQQWDDFIESIETSLNELQSGL